ncbi:hypothetical protein F4821DRAFT_248588 [Hypoxylon rubiginosum]|uniref:Uncharacterized protein n=1 Tax=Hypoxylon rubiginosum TaxID=110542 RepID=A0ACC0CMU1_9PEZI|nr:hypothetical protein F4821DRAFT_248588 [Hypoxylon rubiginosum]
MPSNSDFSPSSDDSSQSDQTPTTNPPWPNVTPVQQAQVERKWFEEGATIHFDRLPVRFDRWDSSPYIITKVIRLANAAQRPLTAGEIDATSEAAAISAQYVPWIRPLTVSSSLLFTWYTRKSFSFAFYRPKASRFDPSVFPMKRAPLLRGTWAVLAWHTIRALTYLPPFGLCSVLFCGSMTESTFEAHVRRDQRLQVMMRDIKINNHKNASARTQQRNPPINPPIPANQSSQDGGREPYTSQPENAFGGSAPVPSTGVTSPASRPTWAQTNQSQAPPSQPRDEVSDLFEDDDGSPVSASTRRAEAQQARDSQGGSAWDRLRQQAQTGSAQWTKGDSSGQEQGWGQLRQDKTQNSKEIQRSTEGFAYTKEEEYKEQKNYEKEQAQKEFDALLEAERRGGSGRR